LFCNFETVPIDEFMNVPTTEQKKRCIRAFIEATSNASLVSAVCVVCARELMKNQGDEYPIFGIPNARTLLVSTGHIEPSELWEGMLLVRDHVRGKGKKGRGWVCDECRNSLIQDKLPKLSLANNMWIGHAPLSLQSLTIPEQLLIARHYPRCYVFKLYPRNSNIPIHPDQLQRGMSGNVSLYELNTSAIVQMLEGNLMPQECKILASVLAVSFIGTKKIPKSWLKTTFQVRRRRVYEALTWLKANNALYHDIEISNERLNSLPEDGVPDEIIAIARHEEDDDIAVQERESYVPDVNDGSSE
jgi:hypothetical protein